MRGMAQLHRKCPWPSAATCKCLGIVALIAARPPGAARYWDTMDVSKAAFWSNLCCIFAAKQVLLLKRFSGIHAVLPAMGHECALLLAISDCACVSS